MEKNNAESMNDPSSSQYIWAPEDTFWAGGLPLTIDPFGKEFAPKNLEIIENGFWLGCRQFQVWFTLDDLQKFLLEHPQLRLPTDSELEYARRAFGNRNYLRNVTKSRLPLIMCVSCQP